MPSGIPEADFRTALKIRSDDIPYFPPANGSDTRDQNMPTNGKRAQRAIPES